MTKEPTPVVHEEFAAAGQVEPQPVAYIIKEALAELKKHKDASATVWSGLNANHPFNKDAVALYATHQPGAEAVEPEQKPLGYITPDALEQLRLGIDCQPIHKDTCWGFTVPVYASPVRSAQEAVKVSRDDAIKFLEGACRNWSKVPRLSTDDLDDVATELTRFFAKRSALLPPGGETATPDTPAPVTDLRVTALQKIADEIAALKLHPTTSEEYDAGYIAARIDVFAIVQEAIDNAD